MSQSWKAAVSFVTVNPSNMCVLKQDTSVNTGYPSTVLYSSPFISISYIVTCTRVSNFVSTVLPPSDDGRSDNRMVCITKVKPLVTGITTQVKSYVLRRGHSQSGRRLSSWVITKANLCISPWSILKNIRHKWKKEFRTSLGLASV